MKKLFVALLGFSLLTPLFTNAQAVPPTKHHVNKDTGDRTKTTQYQDTPNYSQRGKQGWEIKKEEWQAKQPPKHHTNRNK